MTVAGINGTNYSLNPTPIGSGGEGDIFGVIGQNYVAKIYRAGVLSSELEEKLKIMIGNPPDASVLSQVAWPLDMAYDNSGKPCGFIMPKLNIDAELGEIYRYPPTLSLTTRQKIHIAQNICVVISEVHKAGYVFGDFNPRNIGLDKSSGFVSFLDTDSYHVTDRLRGSTYRCNVCAPGYAAPELLEKCSDFSAQNPSASKNAYALTPLPTFTQETDNFALAIHVFKLIMNGFTPYGGIIESASVSQSSPGVGDAAVRRDSYCFKPGSKHQSTAILPPEALPNEIMDLFNRAFIEGKLNPQRRPTSAEWYAALDRFGKSMVTCSRNHLHQYDRKNTECPLCAADNRFMAVTGQAVVVPHLQPSPSTSHAPYSSIQAPPLHQQVPVAGSQMSSPVKPPSPSNMPPKPKRVSPVDIIRGSRIRIRKLSTIFSLLLWTLTIIAYFAISYQLGYTEFSLDFANFAYMSGAWIIFVFAALIGCGVELLFSSRELKVLTGTIDLRELKGSGVEVELREYKKQLTNKIGILRVVFVILVFATIAIAAVQL